MCVCNTLYRSILIIAFLDGFLSKSVFFPLVHSLRDPMTFRRLSRSTSSPQPGVIEVPGSGTRVKRGNNVLPGYQMWKTPWFFFPPQDVRRNKRLMFHIDVNE